MGGRKTMTNSGYGLFVKVSGRELVEKQLGRRVAPHDAYSLCGDMWDNMTAEVKAQWKQQARDYKHTDKFHHEKEAFRTRDLNLRAHAASLNGVPPNSQRTKLLRVGKGKIPAGILEDHVVVRQYYSLPAEAGDWGQKRSRDRDEMRDTLIWDGGHEPCKYLLNKDWWLMSVVHWWEIIPTEDAVMEFAPAELSLVKFSIARGIDTTESKHFFLKRPSMQRMDPEMQDQARARSLDLRTGHGIPLHATDSAAGIGKFYEYNEVMKMIEDLTRGSKKILCPQAAYNATVGGVSYMRTSSGQGMSSEAPLAPKRFVALEDWLSAAVGFGASANCAPPQKALDEACAQAAWSDYDFHVQTLCAFHVSPEIRRRNCSLAAARKGLYGVFSMLLKYSNLYVCPEDIAGPSFIPPAPAATKDDVNLQLASPKEEDAPVTPPPTIFRPPQLLGPSVPAVERRTPAIGRGLFGSPVAEAPRRTGLGRGRPVSARPPSAPGQPPSPPHIFRRISPDSMEPQQ